MYPQGSLYKCNNIDGECENAIKKITFSIPAGEELKCPICGKKDIELVKGAPPPPPWKKIILFIAIALVLGVIGYELLKQPPIPADTSANIKDTTNNVKIPLNIPHYTDTSPLADTLGQALLTLIDTTKSDKQRLALVTQLMQTEFSQNFWVKMYQDSVNGIAETWGAGHGIDYLQRLATYNAITSFDVVSVHKNTTDGKIADIEIVEKHKN